MFHFHVGKAGAGHSLHSPILHKCPVHHISGEWGACLYPFSSSGRMWLFHMMYPISLDISQVFTFLLMQSVLLRAAYVPQMGLAIIPKVLFDIHKTLIDIAVAVLHNEEIENPVYLSQCVLPNK